MAAWAVALGVCLILVATATSRAATTGGTGLGPSSGSSPAAAGGVNTGGAPPPDPAVAQMPVRLASWYGPGLYGKQTACGIRLRRTTLGVANRRLPCGLLVKLFYRGHFLTLPVIDRGPYSRRVTWDLTAAAAQQLGLKRTDSIRSSP